MARGAFDIAFAAVADREVMLAQLRGQPTIDRMAHGAIGTEHPGVNRRIGMTSAARCTDLTKVGGLMALIAIQLGMAAVQ